MATIPIEVIVQDVETPANPTSTPETNSTEESIAVPDTGAGTIGNSAFSNSSVASIIVPAVLLILALATICTLLIRRHKYQDNKANKREKLAASISTTIAILAATVLVGNLVLPATKAATSDSEVSIEAPDKISIVVNREDDTTEATTEATAYITSTATFGYKVLLSMVEGVDTANLYLYGDTTSEYYIAPVEGEELAANTWGYTLADEETYSAVPLVDTPAAIAEDAEVAEDRELAVSYTVNIDKSLPAGAYTGELEYSIDAKPVPTAIGALTYMQDFAKLATENKVSVLASMREGEQYILKDIRDKKPYYISKLADGNVWMTQNLDLDIQANRIYTSEDTDLAYSTIGTSWNPIASGATRAASDTTWNSSYTIPESYDPGDLYWNGIVNSNWGGNIDDNTVANGEAHFSVGNYYNWTAAVAMNNSETYGSQQVIDQSICPSGWKLPNKTGDKSYSDLINLYNLSSGSSGNIQEPPLYFTYTSQWAGFKDNEMGGFGYFWTNEVSYSEGATNFYFNLFSSKGFNDYNNRYIGYPVRCVTR